MNKNSGNFIKNYYDQSTFTSPYLITEEKLEKVSAEIQKIFLQTDWRIVFSNEFIKLEYNNIPITSFSKALCLPYLLYIYSERELSRALIKYKMLRDVCGFTSGDSIGHRTFWHFRNAFKNEYSEFIIRSLVAIVIGNYQQPFLFPFVERSSKIPSDYFISKKIKNKYTNDIQLYMNIEKNRPETISDSNTKTSDEELQKHKMYWTREFIEIKKNYPTDQKEWEKKYIEFEKTRREIKDKYSKRPCKNFFDIGLPVYIRTIIDLDEELLFKLIKPVRRKTKIYNSIFRLEEESTEYIAACNLLVIRGIENEKEILLSRRIDSKGNLGPYAIPGGKQKNGETLKNCARRELEEETSLIMLDSKIIDVRKNTTMGEDVFSIGILVNSFKGQPQTLESNKHEEWKWFSIEKLPNDIFDHSNRVIKAYKKNGGKEIYTWEGFENLDYIQDKLIIE